jgi:transposase
VIDLKRKQRIILMHLDGVSNREIAAQLHMSKDTINKYVHEYDEKKKELLKFNPNQDPNEIIQEIVKKPKYDSSTRKPYKVSNDVIELINDCIKLNDEKRITGRSKQIMLKKDIYQYVRDKGYPLSYSTVKRLIDTQENRHYEAFIKQEYSLGEICEFDWGTVKLNINNAGYEAYQMAVFTPAFNNYRFALLFKSQDTAAFQESHTAFFAHCKGCYKTMVYDNMRVAVRKFVGFTEKEPTEALTQLSIYYGFKFRFCNIARGNEKGHVERSVEYVRRKVFSKPEKDCFDSLEDANRYLIQECIRINSEKISDGKIPLEGFIKEQKYLRPELPKFESCIYSENRVDKYATVTVRQNHYSVPDIYVGKMVSVKLYTSKLVIYHENTQIAVHKRTFGLNDWSINIYHYLRTLKRKPGALPQSTALLQADTRVKNLYERYYTKDPKMFLEVLEIIKEKGIDEVEKSLKRLEVMSPFDLSADKIKLICAKTTEENNLIKPGTDSVSEKSQQILLLYDNLTFNRKINAREDTLCN